MGRGFLFILLLIALPATAQIYKYTDANGNTAYSNQPPDGVNAQPVELPPLNSVEPQPRTDATCHTHRSRATAAAPTRCWS